MQRIRMKFFLKTQKKDAIFVPEGVMWQEFANNDGYYFFETCPGSNDQAGY